jgi:hypothetical protein
LGIFFILLITYAASLGGGTFQGEVIKENLFFIGYGKKRQNKVKSALGGENIFKLEAALRKYRQTVLACNF